MRSSASWWASRARQFRAHLRARVTPEERAALVAWTTPAQLALFDSMHVADRRHGLDVVASLRAEGVDEPDVLVAGLLHDAGKGDTGVWPRVAYTLGQPLRGVDLAGRGHLPGVRLGAGAASDARRDRSAVLAAAAGCSPRTVGLIRHQDSPTRSGLRRVAAARRRGQLMNGGIAWRPGHGPPWRRPRRR